MALVNGWWDWARKMPIRGNFTARRRTRTDGVILHATAAGNTASQWSWFDDDPNVDDTDYNASSTLHLSKAGVWEQYLPADQISWANGEGNPRTVTIEIQNSGSEPLTQAQVDQLVLRLPEICGDFDVPLVLMPNSKPTSRGVGWHRLGVDGNFPTGLLGGRRQRGGGEKWSSAFGKVCPGDDVIRQIPDIVARAAGGTTTVPEEDDVSLKDKIAFPPTTEAGKKFGNRYTGEQLLGYAGLTIFELPKLSKQVASLTAAVKALAMERGIDGDALVERILAQTQAALDEAFDDVAITLTTKES